MLNDALEGTDLKMIQIKFLFLWAIVRSSQSLLCSASLCRINDVVKETSTSFM
jgi:hypothetical protein